MLTKISEIIKSKLVLLSVFFIISLYFLLSVYKIKYPGLQYDEVLFVNAAIGGIDTSFITYKIGNIPVHLMTYIGALKSYIYFPIFKLFGVSAYSIRIPVILITCLMLFVVFKLVKLSFNKKIALITLLLLSVNSTLISYTRADVGPNTLELLLKSLSIYFIYKIFKTSKFRYLFFALVCLGLGLFNKINFLWFINSFSFALVIVYYREIFNVLKKYSLIKKSLAIVFILISYGSYFSYYYWIQTKYKLHDEISLETIDKNYNKVEINIENIVDGDAFYNYALGDINLRISDYYKVSFGIILIIGLFINLFYKNEKLYKKAYFFNLLISATTLLQVLLTKQATAPWHVITLYPFITILLVYSLYSFYIIFTNINLKFRYKYTLVNTVSFLIILMLFSYNIFVYSKYIGIYKETVKNSAWTPKIYSLAEYTKTHDDKFVSLDWGIHNQLIILTQQKNKYVEQAFYLNTYPDDVQKKWFYDNYLNPALDYKFITHGEKTSLVTNSRVNFMKVALDSDISLKKVATFADEKNVMFEIYEPLTAK